MTLDEAIKHAEEVAEAKFDNAIYIMDKMKSNVALSNAEECRKCAEEHRQLAEWLKDYKRLLEQGSIFNKISAEIITKSFPKDEEGFSKFVYLKDILEIIDKYKKSEAEG